MSPPCSQLKGKPGKKPAAACFMLISCLAYSMEATFFSKTSDDYQQTTWHYIPEE
jgi:hypothetical protein